jgi:hypothetical protein
MLIQIILSVIMLCLSYPIALLLAKVTKDEKKLYKRYFSSLIWIFAILAAIFFAINTVSALTLTFMFLLVFFWNRF